MKILIICTGNACRSQMAEGFLKKFKPEWEVFSAGTFPASAVTAKAIRAMKEIGIDISGNHPKNVEEFISQSFDYVITVCDNAKEACPVFLGNVQHRLHMGFEDPGNAIGSDEFILNEHRRVRDEIAKKFSDFAEQFPSTQGYRKSWE